MTPKLISSREHEYPEMLATKELMLLVCGKLWELNELQSWSQVENMDIWKHMLLNSCDVCLNSMNSKADLKWKTWISGNISYYDYLETLTTKELMLLVYGKLWELNELQSWFNWLLSWSQVKYPETFATKDLVLFVWTQWTPKLISSGKHESLETLVWPDYENFVYGHTTGQSDAIALKIPLR
jgi:hypothetical protein